MIRLEHLSKTFQTDRGEVHAVRDVNLEVPKGELCVLLGPSGCGKTTTLKIVNRLIPHTSGKIYIDEQDTDKYDVVRLRRNIGYVIQQIGLFPNMTIEENISVVPRMLGWSKDQQKKRASELIDMVALDRSMLQRYPKELSGGQQQRVGVARGLAADPPVLLMDEPFGAIDPINREVIQDEFLKMQGELKKTIMFVSHDIDEAVKMGDKVAIFRGGQLEQFGAPDDVLAHPANEFVADFVGGDRELKRMRLIRIGQALNDHAPTVSSGDSLTTAEQKMNQTGLDIAVVVDADNRPEGYVERRDTGGDGTCADEQHPIPTPVKLKQDLRTAVSRMFTYDLDWLPAIDETGRLAGVVTRAGITATLHAKARMKGAA
jgi:osmoprotectant transport system ATP-binding protein